MSELDVPLLTDHAFVLQPEESQGRPGICRAGRVEQKYANPKLCWGIKYVG